MGGLFGKPEVPKPSPAPQPRTNPSSYYTSTSRPSNYDYTFSRPSTTTGSASSQTTSRPAAPRPAPTSPTYSTGSTYGTYSGASSSTGYSNGSKINDLSTHRTRPTTSTTAYSSGTTLSSSSGAFKGASATTGYSNGSTSYSTPGEVDDLVSSFDRLSVKEPGSVPVYVIGLTDQLACVFQPAREDIIEIPRSNITLKNLEVDHVYHTKISNSVVGDLTIPSALCQKYYAHRENYEFTTVDYKKFVVPALLLGSRVRDFEQRAARVAQLYSLILLIPWQPGRLKVLKLKTTTGETFEVNVNWVARQENEDTAHKQLRVGCTPVKPLPPVVRKDTLLQIVGSRDREPVVTASLARLYSGSMLIRNEHLLDCIYGKPASKMYPSVTNAPVPYIQLKSLERVVLNAEQAEAIARYNSTCPAFVVESPPGSGKTMTAAAMAVCYTGSGVQLFLSTANVPVFNMALALSKLNYGSRTAIHFVSAEREDLMTDETRSPFSVLSLAKQKIRLEATIAKLEGQLEAATTDEDKKKFKDLIRVACGPVLVDKYDIMFATVDMIIGRLNKKASGKGRDSIKSQLLSSVKRIVIDEASQLTEAALNVLINSFPDAQIVLIGDSKQLPPFKYTKEHLVSDMSARSALDVAKQKKGNLPVIRLLKVYRASPLLMKHYSNVFYAGSLKSVKPESAVNPFSSFGRKAANFRCLFWSVKGVSKQNGTSKINDKEIAALVTIVNHLRTEGYDEKSVMVISYYEAQRKLAEGQLPEGYELLTVDSAQGREKKIVIVLTTRTSVPTDQGGFFTCPLRCNVAVSRHQEGLIVIGHPSIAYAESWAKVIDNKYFKHISE